MNATISPGLVMLDLTAIDIGTPALGDICAADGVVLVRKHETMKISDFERLLQHHATGVFGGPEWPRKYWRDPAGQRAKGERPPIDPRAGQRAPRQEKSEPHGSQRQLAQRSVSVSVDSLRAGHRPRHHVYNAKGALLLRAGTEITEAFLERLRRQRIFKVHTCAPDLGSSQPPPRRLQNKAIRRLDQTLQYMPLDRPLPTPTRPLARPHLPLGDLRAETEKAAGAFNRSVELLEDITQDIINGRRFAVKAAGDVIARFIQKINVDPSLLPAVVRLQESSEEYLFQHGLNVALLSMSAAAGLSVTQEEVLQIGLGALLQDIGMTCIPQDLRLAPRALTDDEKAEISQHPVYSLGYLERLHGISDLTKLIVYQSHERCDRSGYPNRRHRMLIHPYARLVAAADTYAAIIANRPHRSARSPYEAMTTLLHGVRRDSFDADAIRTFLDCMALFPIGSYVRLSDGRFAQVIRANPGAHTRPVVIVIGPDGRTSDEEVDLLRAGELKVIQALRNAGEMPTAPREAETRADSFAPRPGETRREDGGAGRLDW